MNRNFILLIAAVLLTALAVYLFYLGNKANLMPPKLTGVGFIVIAIAFLGLRNKEK